MSASAAADGHWLSDALLRNWGTKAIALVLALVVFVMTRDEVTRTYKVQLDVRTDPDRVLLTQLPDTVEVEVRGPWARMAQLRPSDLGSATIDLRAADPGPLALDPAAIVMPEGVVLEDLVYERVDLRFEAIIERELTVMAQLAGEVHADYERVTLRVQPERWVVRGPQRTIDALTQLQTETVSLNGATETVEQRAAIIRPEPGVMFVGSIDGRREPVVEVEVEIRPRRGQRELEVELGPRLGQALQDRSAGWALVEAPPTKPVTISGPVPALRQLEKLPNPVQPQVELSRFSPPRGRGETQGTVEAQVEWQWAPDVPTELREQLDLAPASLRLDLRFGPAPK